VRSCEDAKISSVLSRSMGMRRGGAVLYVK
jgi:hypothetical protein